MAKYNSKGEEAGEPKGKKGPAMAEEMAENEGKMLKVGKVRKAKIGKATAQVAKTKRVVSKKTNNAGMKGNVRTVLKDDLKKAL